EIDLRLRGPGDIAGTKQSGLLDLKIANIVKDEPILKAARNTAIEIAQQDPMLITPQNQKLKEYFQRTKPQIDFSQIS
ncbi:MAG: ATP-dependent DNA helicase RecG, partial [Bacteroidales bacterium]|nr:ATP-dependent DNA helicase RecG [Bacteroidales bacterium]